MNSIVIHAAVNGWIVHFNKAGGKDNPTINEAYVARSEAELSELVADLAKKIKKDQ
jgi:hypothetical protein